MLHEKFSVAASELFSLHVLCFICVCVCLFVLVCASYTWRRWWW